MNQKQLETIVGAFLMMGIILLAGLILVFGGMLEQYGPSYQVTVEFPNASDLLKGATVSFGGAPIGKVSEKPYPVREGRAVAVTLRIKSEFQIRQDARFLIGTKGLLGDRFVDVQPQGDTASFIKDKAVVKGERVSGIGELADDVKPIMERADVIAERMQNITKKFDEQVLTPETAADLRASIKSFKSVSARLDDLLAQAQKGKGPLAKLLNDEKMASELKDFVSNLKKHGPLFYSDSAGEQASERSKEKKR